MTNELQVHNAEEAILLFGKNGELRKRIQAELGVRIVDRGEKVLVVGDEADTAAALHLLNELLISVRKGFIPTEDDLAFALSEARAHSTEELSPTFEAGSGVLRRDIRINPRTRGQGAYLKTIEQCDVTLVIGPAGTGKTYLAMAAAVSAMLNNQVSRIILTRPAVEAGESLGFLPGDLQQKVNPYLRPLYDALYSMVDIKRAHQLIEREKIEVAPLAFMRGRTLHHAFVILDEAQNTTSEQMKMFLTRMGEHSRVIITGDITQIDLPRGVKSGLVEANRILKDTPGIGIVHLTRNDVVRHPLVQRIVDAYEHDEQGAHKPTSEHNSSSTGSR